MNLLKPFLALFIVTLVSCGGGGETNSEDETNAENSNLPEVLQRGVTTIDLGEHFINASFIIPDSMRGYPEVQQNPFGGTQVTVGSTYNIVITEHLDGTIQTKAQALSEDLMYKNEIVKQGDDFILYKSVIADSYVDPEFHFYAIKDINGVSYEIHDYNEEGGYAESVARFMLESVNHLEPNNPAS